MPRPAIVLCRSTSPLLPESLADGAASWIELLPAGPDVEGLDGRKFTIRDPNAVVTSFNRRKLEIPIDIEHSTHIKGPKGEPAPAMGWVVEMQVHANRSVWGLVNWNADGVDYVKGKKYKYTSPAFRPDAKGNVASLASAGLTNSPNFVMTALNSEGSEPDMKVDPKILAALGLDEDASLQDVLDAIARNNTALNRRTPSLDEYVPRADYNLVLNRASSAEAAIKTAKDEALLVEINAAIEKAASEGAVVPETVEYHREQCKLPGGLERFKQFAKNTPKIGNPSGLDGKRPGIVTGAAGLSADQLAMCRRMDMTPEQFIASEKEVQDNLLITAQG